MSGRRVAVEAVLWTAGVETPYRRAGSGPPVLLLSPGRDDALFWRLAGTHRVVAPARVPPAGAGGGDWEAWLRGVIDGLGLERPIVVAAEALAPAVERCARRDPERIRSVIVPGPDAGGIEAALRAVAAARDD